MVALYEGLRNFVCHAKQNKTSVIFVALIESLRHLSGIYCHHGLPRFKLKHEVSPQVVPDAEKALVRLLYHTTQNVILMHQSIPALLIPLVINRTFFHIIRLQLGSWSTPRYLTSS